DGIVRVELPLITFEEIGEFAFGPLRAIAYRDVHVALRVMKVLERMGRAATDQERKNWVMRQAQLVHRGTINHIDKPEDGQQLGEQLALIESVLTESPSAIQN